MDLVGNQDQVAIDAVAAKLMGMDPLRDCKYIRLAHELGLGCGDVSQIEIVGDKERYEGGFRAGKRHGYGQVTGPGDKVQSGRWNDGKLVESAP